MPNPKSDVGEVKYLTVRECAEALGIHAQTLKNWLVSNRYRVATLLEPVRYGRNYKGLLIPIKSWDRFVTDYWPAIRERMKGRGRKTKERQIGQEVK